MWRQRFVIVTTMCMLAASTIGARQGNLTTPRIKTGVWIQTGLLSFFTGAARSAEVTITELGPPGVTSTVRVVFYDEAEQILFRAAGELKREQPFNAVFPLDMAARRAKVRASITIVGEPDEKRIPVMVLEEIDLDSFTIEERVSCSPPEDKEGATPYCPPPAVVSTFVTRG